MGNMILDQLGAHQMSFKGLGIPELTPDVQKLVDSVHAEVGSRTIEPEAERGAKGASNFLCRLRLLTDSKRREQGLHCFESGRAVRRIA